MSEGESGYRPWLDGLRGIAVLAVLVGHTFPELGLSLGDTGVALFFALSGYLITGLLLGEWARTGTVRLGQFYLRRAARLFPALLLVVVVMDGLFALTGSAGVALFSLPALLYNTNYVAVAVGWHLPAFGPTWSLAVEEHFYLAWPPALVALLRRFSLRHVLAATLAICIADLLWRAVLAMADVPDLLLYLGSIERADALLYGCAAAMALERGWSPSRWLVAGSACVLVGHLLTPTVTSPVFDSMILGLTSAVVICGIDRWKKTQRYFSLRPLVAVGVRSYGIYLWHMPLLWLGMLAIGNDSPIRILMSAMAVASAWLSYRWLEAPVRAWARGQLHGGNSELNSPTHRSRQRLPMWSRVPE